MSLDFGFVLFFVRDPHVSARFYERLLQTPPVEESDTFALFPLPNGTMLGLWSPKSAHPAPTGGPGSTEIAFLTEDVDAAYVDWKSRDIPTVTVPEDLDFGRTFIAADPDGHRIRVMKLFEA
jgi:catechol 2,3-dioxygenase-like lactoylglutathione lyase family enzyme